MIEINFFYAENKYASLIAGVVPKESFYKIHNFRKYFGWGKITEQCVTRIVWYLPSSETSLQHQKSTRQLNFAWPLAYFGGLSDQAFIFGGGGEE